MSSLLNELRELARRRLLERQAPTASLGEQAEFVVLDAWIRCNNIVFFCLDGRLVEISVIGFESVINQIVSMLKEGKCVRVRASLLGSRALSCTVIGEEHVEIPEDEEHMGFAEPTMARTRAVIVKKDGNQVIVSNKSIKGAKLPSDAPALIKFIPYYAHGSGGREFILMLHYEVVERLEQLLGGEAEQGQPQPQQQQSGEQVGVEEVPDEPVFG